MLDGRSDNGYARVEGDHHQIMANGNFNSNSRAAEYYYTLHLKHVGRLNTYIANINGPYVENEAIRTRYENILKALRIWHYFELTFHWGDVPFYLPAGRFRRCITATYAKRKDTRRDLSNGRRNCQ